MRPTGLWSRPSFMVDGSWIVASMVVAVLLLRATPCGGQVTTVQIPENTPPDTFLQLGPLHLSPILELRNIGIDYNVFNDAAEERDFTATPSAELTAVTLSGPMRFTGVLNTEYVWFQKFRSERSINGSYNLRVEGFFDRLRPWATGEVARTRERQGLEIDIRALRVEPTFAAVQRWRYRVRWRASSMRISRCSRVRIWRSSSTARPGGTAPGCGSSSLR